MDVKLKLFNFLMLIFLGFQFSSESFGQKNNSKLDNLPADQKDFIRSMLLADVVYDNANRIVNPISKQEAISAALRTKEGVVAGFVKKLNEDGLKDWVGMCTLNSDSVRISVEINPRIRSHLTFECVFATNDDKSKLEPMVWANLKKYTKPELVKFTIEDLEGKAKKTVRSNDKKDQKNPINNGLIRIQPENLLSLTYLTFKK